MPNNSAQVVSRTTTSMTVNVYSNHNTGPSLENAPFSIMVAGQAAEAVAAEAVHFDGATYISMSTTFSGVADSATGSLSVWLNWDGNTTSDSFQNILADYAGAHDSDLIFDIFESTQSPPSNLRMGWTPAVNGNIGGSASGAGTSASTVTPGVWQNWLISWDTSITTAPICQVYINDVVSPTTDDGTAAGPFTVKYASIAGWVVGAQLTTMSAASGFYSGDMCDLWFAPGQYIDFSNVTNRRKFIDALGARVDLGATGDLPTGTAPAVFFRGDAAVFGANQGTGGTFSTTGTLTDATAPP